MIKLERPLLRYSCKPNEFYAWDGDIAVLKQWVQNTCPASTYITEFVNAAKDDVLVVTFLDDADMALCLLSFPTKLARR